MNNSLKAAMTYGLVSLGLITTSLHFRGAALQDRAPYATFDVARLESLQAALAKRPETLADMDVQRRQAETYERLLSDQAIRETWATYTAHTGRVNQSGLFYAIGWGIAGLSAYTFLLGCTKGERAQSTGSLISRTAPELQPPSQTR